MRYAADPPDARRTVALDELTAVYHRRSGATHLLAEPAARMLDALAAGPADAGEVARRLDAAGEEEAVAARLAELSEAGLAWRA